MRVLDIWMDGRDAGCSFNQKHRSLALLMVAGCVFSQCPICPGGSERCQGQRVVPGAGPARAAAVTSLSTPRGDGLGRSIDVMAVVECSTRVTHTVR